MEAMLASEGQAFSSAEQAGMYADKGVAETFTFRLLEAEASFASAVATDPLSASHWNNRGVLRRGRRAGRDGRTGGWREGQGKAGSRE